MAAYLDGPGRAAARTLPRLAALAYAGETMRLTTRLMQVASWLMVQRAVREGELTPAEARSETYRLGDRSGPNPETFHAMAQLPAQLVALAERGDALFSRVVRLDAGIQGEGDGAHGAAGQMARLRAAFGDPG
jgi:regulator of CtrA degradation